MPLDRFKKKAHFPAMLGHPLMTRLKSCLLLLAGLAIAAQAMIPLGFMPDIEGAGGRTIVICSGVDQKIIHLPGDDAPGPHQDSSKSCAFSFAPMAEKPVAVLPVTVAAAIVEAAVIVFYSLSETFLDRAHPPTGPPASL